MGRDFLSRSIAKAQIIETVPEFTSVSNALNYWNLNPPPDRVVGINGQACRWWPGNRFEYGDRTDGASGLWIPTDFDGADVKCVYHGGVADDAAPNSSWDFGATETASGTVSVTSVANQETELLADADADLAYLRWPSSGDFDAPVIDSHLIYMKVSSDTGSATANSASIRMQFYDGTRLITYYLTYAAADCQYGWQYTSSDPYPRSAAHVYGTDFTELLFKLHTYKGADDFYEVWNYASMRPIGTCSIGDFGANSTRALFIGNNTASYSGKLKLRGFPALAVIGF